MTHDDPTVTRRVGGVTRGHGDQHRLVTLRRTLPAPLERSWAAVSRSEEVGAWFIPITGDLQHGGHYQLEGHASGDVLDCVVDERWSVSWHTGEQVSYVDVSLRPVDGGTLVQLDHAVPQDDHWTTYGPAAVGLGWEQALGALAAHVADAPAPAPWTRDDLAAAADEWVAGAVADGDDPDWARAAADRCVASYAG